MKTELQDLGYGGAPCSLVVSGSPVAGECVQIDSDREDPHGELSPDPVSSPIHESAGEEVAASGSSAQEVGSVPVEEGGILEASGSDRYAAHHQKIIASSSNGGGSGSGDEARASGGKQAGLLGRGSRCDEVVSRGANSGEEHDYSTVWVDVIGWRSEEVAADPGGQHGCRSFRTMLMRYV